MLWEKGGGDIAREWSSVAQEQGADNLVAGEIPECLRAGTRCCPLAHSSFLIICSCTPSFFHVNPGAPDRGQGCSTLSSVPPGAYHGAWLIQSRMDGWMDGWMDGFRENLSQSLLLLSLSSDLLPPCRLRCLFHHEALADPSRPPLYLTGTSTAHVSRVCSEPRSWGSELISSIGAQT